VHGYAIPCCGVPSRHRRRPGLSRRHTHRQLVIPANIGDRRIGFSRMPTFVLAHLSDPHLAPLPTPRPYELAGKRLLGYVNSRHNRRHFHLRPTLDRIVADLKTHTVDHIAVTGDLVNLSLGSEYQLARDWLAQLGDPRDVTVIPGNHDAYVLGKARHPERLWGDYMGDDKAAVTFPFVRRRGPVALIGINTGVPTPPFFATGRVGR